MILFFSTNDHHGDDYDDDRDENDNYHDNDNVHGDPDYLADHQSRVQCQTSLAVFLNLFQILFSLNNFLLLSIIIHYYFYLLAPKVLFKDL